MVKTVLGVLSAALLLAACGENGGKPAAITTAPARTTGAAQVARGAQIYKAHCAECHGANAEGAPNWHRPGPDGKYPAPPLDEKGHAWHHPGDALVKTIKEGTLALGGNMPAWKDKLRDADIDAVIAWFQSRWPEEVYNNWALMDRKARQDRSAR